MKTTLFNRLTAGLLAAVLCLSVLAGCAAKPQKELTRYSTIFYDVFDTVTQVIAYCESEEEFTKQMEALHADLISYNQLYDIYNDYDGVVNVKTINDNAGKAPVQVIWQTGKYYEREMQAFLAAHPAAHVWQGAFIDRMDYAYAAADLVVSRSGAGTVSELCLVAKPVLFVPSPNVAEDHQTKNARALEAKGAAVVVPDAECRTKAMPRAVELLADRETLAAMSRNLEALARPDAAEDIVNEIVKVMK